MFECWWHGGGFEAWRLRGDLRGVSKRWQHRLGDELWLWFNRSGEGVVWGRDHRIFLKEGLYGCFAGEEGEDWKWTRLPGRHEAEILVIPREQVARLIHERGARDPRLRAWPGGGKGLSFAGLMGSAEWLLLERLKKGWKSQSLPSGFLRELEGWFQLPEPQVSRPRAAACGRSRRSAQVMTTKPMSHQSQCEAGIK